MQSLRFIRAVGRAVKVLDGRVPGFRQLYGQRAIKVLGMGRELINQTIEEIERDLADVPDIRKLGQGLASKLRRR